MFHWFRGQRRSTKIMDITIENKLQKPFTKKTRFYYMFKRQRLDQKFYKIVSMDQIPNPLQYTP